MSDHRKKLPVGVENFEKLINDNYYFVDKSAMIAELINYPAEVTLFTRPRRFGKSLNMSMLEQFFSPETDKSVFDGLAISREKEICEAYMGRYPVISLSLKRIDAGSYETAYAQAVQMMNDAARAVYGQVAGSKKLDSQDFAALDRLRQTEIGEADLYAGLYTLSGLLNRHFGQKVIILIDEYDVPLAKAHEYGFYDRMVILIRSLFQQALKTNSSLQFAVLTGCMRISKESIFTGLNNLLTVSVSDREFDACFGFTDEEVKNLLVYYDLQDFYPEVKDWYDGYRFGNRDVYCPWDVLCYCRKLGTDRTLPPENYWINSSSNYAVRKLVSCSGSGTVKNEIEQLVNGETLEKTIKQELTYQDMYDSVENIWSVLYTTGYLTSRERIDGTRFRLAIPNREIRYIFAEQIMELFREDVGKDKKTLSAFCAAFEQGDAAGVETVFGSYLRKTISIRDTAVRRAKKENFYHGILLGILSMNDAWIVRSNEESGDGYSDILVRDEEKNLAILIELKYADGCSMEEASRQALEQIEEKQYAAALAEDGYEQVLKYGIACLKKRCRVLCETAC